MTRKSLVLVTILSVLSLPTLSPSRTPETNSWQQLKAPNGGIAMSLDTRQDGQIVAGTFGGGIFLSADQGQTWEPASKGLKDPDVFAVVVDPAGRTFAGTFGGGIYRTAPNATEWVAVNEGLASLEIVALAVTPEGDLLAGTSNNGVYFSNDGGEYWWSIGLEGHFVTSLAANSVGHFFAATTNGLYRSTTNGRSWEQISQSLESSDVRAVRMNDQQHIFAATNGGGMYRSTDNGNSWNRLRGGLTSYNIGSIAFGNGGVVYCGTTEGIFLSSDNGNYWNHLNTGIRPIAVRSLTITSGGQIIAGTVAGGIFRGSLNSISAIPGKDIQTFENLVGSILHFPPH